MCSSLIQGKLGWLWVLSKGDCNCCIHCISQWGEDVNIKKKKKKEKEKKSKQNLVKLID